MAADFPLQYSCSPLLNVSSTAPTVASFGFLARYVRIDNLSAVNLFVNFQNANATTSGFFITSSSATGRAGLDYYEPGALNRSVPVAGLGLQTTSTGAGGALVSILALG